MDTERIQKMISMLRAMRGQMKPSLDYGPRNLRQAAQAELTAAGDAIEALLRLEATVDNYSREFTKSLNLLND